MRSTLTLHLALTLAALAAALAGCAKEEANPVSLPPPPQTPRPEASQPPQAAPPSQASGKTSPRRTAPPRITANTAENTFVVGPPRPNFVAVPAERPFGEAPYSVQKPLAGGTASSFLATVKRRAPWSSAATTYDFPEEFAPIPAEGADAETGMPLRIRCTVDDSQMALVPGGGFIRGVDGKAPEAAPAHAAYVDTFYMDVYEVTVGQYRRFREANTGQRTEPCLNETDPDNMPALGVSWRDAVLYAKWAKKELPTEAEWELAARGNNGYAHPWGDSRAVWERQRQAGQIDPVGSFRNDRSVFGIYDLAGNAREWTADWFSADAYARAKTPDGSPVRNPTGPDRPSRPNERVIKGAGSDGWHLWARSGLSMREQIPSVGFRLILRTPAPEEDAEETATPARSNL